METFETIEHWKKKQNKIQIRYMKLISKNKQKKKIREIKTCSNDEENLEKDILCLVFMRHFSKIPM